jgi:glutamate/tyrosine decarboxylase-like PLP-dependent enzyme
VRLAPGPPLRRRPEPDRAALLHELARARLRRGRELNDGTPPLTLAPEELRRLGHRVLDAVIDYWQALPERPPLLTADAAALHERLAGPPPDGPGDVDAALDLLLTDVLPHMQHTQHPRFFARVPSPSNPVGPLADLLAAGLNVFVASWGGGSGPTALELTVLDWIRGWCGLPADAEGVLVSGGSVGSLTALGAARAESGGGVAYVSDQTHSSVVRALGILGLPASDIRVLPSDDAYSLRAATVAEAVAQDRAAGRTPWCIVATAGTTNTGSVDELGAIADVAQAEGLWLHVDGAYGAPAVLTDHGRAALAGLDRADSLVLDPHKWLFQNAEIGCVLVRRPGALARAFAMSPEYLRDVLAGEVDFRDRGPQLTRGTRALKLWLSLQAFGLDAFRAAIARGIALAERAQQRIEEAGGLELVTPAQLGIVTFREVRDGETGEQLDARNHDLSERVVADGFAAPSTTVLRGRTVLRLCTLNPRTTDEDIDRTVARIAELAQAPD